MATYKEGMHIKQRKWNRKQLGVWAKQKVKERRKNGREKEEEEKEAGCSGSQLRCSILFDRVILQYIYKFFFYCIFLRTQGVHFNMPHNQTRGL